MPRPRRYARMSSGRCRRPWHAKANLKWTPQPAMPGQLRAVTNWVGPVGTGAQLANALRSWSVLRFEVTEDPSAGVDGHRFCHTPQLGLWSGAMSANGDVMVGEMRLRIVDGRRRRRAGRRTGLGARHARGTRRSSLPRRRRRRRGHWLSGSGLAAVTSHAGRSRMQRAGTPLTSGRATGQANSPSA